MSNVTERLARAALAISGVQNEILEWVGHHPYLSAFDLSVLLNIEKARIEKHLLNLENLALVDSVVRRVEREDVASPRYFLTADGLRMLAARDGVPPLRYGRRGVFAADGGEGTKGGMRLAGLFRYFDHPVGANSFFVRLAAEAREPNRRTSHRFVAWLNAAEGQEWFRWRDRSWHIWPDGRAVYEVGQKQFDVLLEWDRGQMRRRDLLEKFRGYATWLESKRVNPSLGARLLVVTTSKENEHMMADLVQEASGNSGNLPALTYVTTRSRWQVSGALGASWRPIIYGGPLMPWWSDQETNFNAIPS